MSKPFRIVTVDDELTHVPFELPTKSGVVEFTIPRLNFLSEKQAKEVRDNLRDIEKPVPLFDPITEEPIWETDADGNEVKDEAGNRKQLQGPEVRTPMERTRVTALAMLTPLVPANVGKVLRGLTAGELEQIVDHWTTVSGTKLTNPDDPEVTDLGESSASSTS